MVELNKLEWYLDYLICLYYTMGSKMKGVFSMPIVGSGDGVHIEYTMPENIKSLITDDFLKEFRNQLFRIHEHYSLDTFADEGIPMNTSTAGWYAALGKACLVTNNLELFDYWRSLEWYDSDIFDGELADMLVDRKFILPSIDEIIYEKLGIESDDLRICGECGKLYTKDMVIDMGENSEFTENSLSQYICLHCHDKVNMKNKNGNATDYYRSILKELDEYKEKHPLT